MAPKKEVVLKLASMRYKKAGISDEEFHEHASKYHGPKAAAIQARHGALKVSQVSIFDRYSKMFLADYNTVPHSTSSSSCYRREAALGIKAWIQAR
jgi:hypothetical protein